MERLKKIGTVKPVHSSEIKTSSMGIGFEKLDRNVFDPNKAYDKVAELGVKWVRIQSGWARTETEKGVYHFEWLDEIVNNLLERGLQPWICLCYGNGLYTENAKNVFGAVGCVPQDTQEERDAWNAYVSAVTKHYHGRVQWYEVWNEPDGEWCWKHGVSGTEYGEFVKRTTQAIRQGDPEAKVIGGVLCIRDLAWLNDVLATGAGKEMDALSYHAYGGDECDSFDRIRALRAICHLHNPDMELIQGETGTQSRSDGSGALRGGAWTPLKQAKFLLRHMLSDLFVNRIKFTSYFSCMDMIEALNGTTGDTASYLDYGYFGVLSADFDENGRASGEYTPKPSYYALQTISAIFHDDFTCIDLPVQTRASHSERIFQTEDGGKELLYGGFRRSNGSAALVYWKPVDLLSTTYESTVTFETAALPGEIQLVDLLNGNIYELPENMIEDNGRGRLLLHHLPLSDSPFLITFGNFLIQ